MMSVKDISKDKKKIEVYQEKRISEPIDDSLKNWKDVKSEIKRLYSIMIKEKGTKFKTFFIISGHEKIRGKPILKYSTKQTINLVNFYTPLQKNKPINKILLKFVDSNENDYRLTKKIKNLEFVGEFYIYDILNEYDNKNYILFSPYYLRTISYEFNGMEVPINTDIDTSNWSKVSAKEKYFFSIAEPKSTEQIMTKKDLIKLTTFLKDNYGMDREGFIEYLYTHPNDNKVYYQSEIVTDIRLSQLFSGKYEGYGLHTLFFGPAGTGKTIELESISHKLGEDVLEASTSTLKSLTPSFKSNKVTPGFLLTSSRLAPVDELSKLIEKQLKNINDASLSGNILSELNSLLEGKTRIIGSGNTGNIKLTCTSQVMFASNFVLNKKYLSQHFDIFDETTISRIFPIVMSKDDYDFVQKNKDNLTLSKYDLSPKIDSFFTPYNENSLNDVKEDKQKFKYQIDVNKIYYNDNQLNFMYTLFDSCKHMDIFEQYNIKKINSLINVCTSLLINPRLKEIFRSRMKHHLILLLDGRVKFRCLFEDYDPSFKVKQEDYEWLEKIMITVVRNYESKLDFN